MVMMSPEMFRDFMRPSLEKMLSFFGGGYHHSCGFFPEHLKVLCEIPGHTYINLGQPELWNLDEAVSQMYDAGVCYYGYWQRLEGEPLEAYLRRGVQLVGPERNRAVLYAYGQGLWPGPAEIMDMWQKLQDEIYPAKQLT